MRQIYWLCIGLCLSSCYEPTDGCLDRDATNFSVDADFPCPNDDCCNYPRLAVRVNAVWGDQALRTDTNYVDGGGNTFRLDRFRLYCSEIRLPLADGDTLLPIDSVEMGRLLAPGDTAFQTLNSNLVLVDHQGNTAGQLAVGEFRQAFTATDLFLQLGLREPYRSVVPETMPDGHPLARQEGLLNFGDENGFVLAKLNYQLPAVFGDSTLSFSVFGDQFLSLPLPAYDLFSRGSNLTVTLDMDYEALFEQVNLQTDSTQLSEGLFDRLPQVVTVRAISNE